MCRQSSHPSALDVYIHIFKDFFDSPPPPPLSNMYTYLPRVCVRVNSIVFTVFTIRIKTLKRYSFLLVLLPYPTRDVNVHILCARWLHTNPEEQEKVDEKNRHAHKQTQIRIRCDTTCSIYNITYIPYNIDRYRNIEKINRKKTTRKG